MLLMNLLNSHDYIADLHSKSHGKKFKTFKEWNKDGYSRIVQDMIGYANYVDKQRKEDAEGDSSTIPEPVIFEKGAGGLPLLPAEVKGARGAEIAKHAQEIIRGYFLRHYRITCFPFFLSNILLMDRNRACDGL